MIVRVGCLEHSRVLVQQIVERNAGRFGLAPPRPQR